MKWISVKDRLPELRQSVVLVNTNRWENTGGDWERNIYNCGYLDELMGHIHWSIRGERAIKIDAFTHWMALPEPPKEKGEE